MRLKKILLVLWNSSALSLSRTNCRIVFTRRQEIKVSKIMQKYA